MKNYEQLNSIAEIYTNYVEEIPNNPLRLANQLQIKCKTKIEYMGEYKDSLCPLYSYPAILCNYGKRNKPQYTIYYDESAQFWGFYVFHELAHYILEHDSDDPDNEREANLLACLLLAPPRLIPTTFKNANDLNVNFHIPLGRAEEYWEKFSKVNNRKAQTLKLKKLLTYTIFSIFTVVSIVFGLNYLHDSSNKNNITDSIQTSQPLQNKTTEFIPNASSEPSINVANESTKQNNIVIVTKTGTKYHLSTCVHVTNRENLKQLTLESAIKNGYSPCQDCIH